MKFTDFQIKNLKAKTNRYEVWEGKGLGIRISPTGRKSWIFMYRFNGKPRRMTLGTYPAMSIAQARAAHGKAQLDLEQGKDPGAGQVQANLEERNALTVEALVEEYLQRWAKRRKRSWREDERILQKDVVPIWGRRKAKEITRRDVLKLLDKIVERGAPIAANRTFEIIRRMFRFAVEQDIIEVSPCYAVRKPAKENQRDRVLMEEEIRLFWNNLGNFKAHESIKLALKFHL